MENMDDQIRKVEGAARGFFSGKERAHDWAHTLRVREIALHLAKVEGADSAIVEMAVLLHDIAREEEEKTKMGVDHAVLGASWARGILGEIGVDKETVERVAHCIESHRFRNEIEPSSIEAKVLYDADKLDSIGLVGVARSFHFAGAHGAKVHNDPEVAGRIEQTEAYGAEDTAYREYALKMVKVKDKILTKEGKRLAVKKHKAMVNFFDEFVREWEGEWMD